MLADLSLNKLSKYFYLKYLGDRDMVLKILIFKNTYILRRRRYLVNHLLLVIHIICFNLFTILFINYKMEYQFLRHFFFWDVFSRVIAGMQPVTRQGLLVELQLSLKLFSVAWVVVLKLPFRDFISSWVGIYTYSSFIYRGALCEGRY